jgi:hypothetical protein
MVAATAAPGLSAPDIAGIRATLDAGRKPKVVFTHAAGQIAGQAGQVVALLDDSSDEWIMVRFGRDELPFSPTDLTIARRAAGRRVAKTAPTPPAPFLDRFEPRAPRPEESMPTATATPPATTADAGSARPTKPAPPPAESVTAELNEKTARRTSRPPKVKPPAALTVTIAYTDGEWSVGAQQGTKALAKPYLIKPSEALRMVAMLDVPGVQEAVEHIVAAERAATQAHADRLRSELAELEARLAELPAGTT